jgi:hypothetical protein
MTVTTLLCMQQVAADSAMEQITSALSEATVRRGEVRYT